MWFYVLKRLVGFVPLALGITLVTFLLVRLVPGDPAMIMAGNFPQPEIVAGLRQRMGLDQPIYVQFLLYLRNIVRGDLGESWFTGHSVLQELSVRAPATLELITLSMVVVAIVGIAVGTLAAMRPAGVVDRLTAVYGLFAGAVPDFWLGLFLIYLFFFHWHLLPAPLGRFGLLGEPPRVTGFALVDSALTGKPELFLSVVSQMVLPVATLSIVFVGGVIRVTRATMVDILYGDYVRYARASGLPDRAIARSALRNAFLPILTTIGFQYSFMIGGAVLVEQVFAWGGLGQFAVQSMVNKDYAAVQGTVLVAALFSLSVYLVVDLLYPIIDPRVRI